MMGKERRKFSLLDLMAFVAASAVGIATALGFRDAVLAKLARPRGYYIHDMIEAGSGLLFSFSVTLLALQMISPQPRWRRIAHQPGAIASLSASVVLLLGLPIAFIANWRPGPTGGAYMSWLVLLEWVPRQVGAAIAAAWALAAMTDRWRPEPTWIDRAGRTLGVTWIAYLLIQSTLEVLII